MMRGATIPAVGVLCLTVMGAASGCPNQADPDSLSDGTTSISKAMTGKTWTGPGGKTCRWWIQTAAGRVTNNGNTTVVRGKRVQKPGRRAEQSQSVIFAAADVDRKFKSDNCGPWTS